MILLSGNESLGSATNGRTLFVFSDTFIVEVNNAGERLPGSTLVNNTLAGLAGDEPDPAKIIFGRRTAWAIQNCICTRHAWDETPELVLDDGWHIAQWEDALVWALHGVGRLGVV